MSDLAHLEGLVIGLEQRGEKSAAACVRWAVAEIERLTEALNTCRELRKYDLAEIEKLRAEGRPRGDSESVGYP